ncbi:MBL fold metallo-hydrolase [Spirochaetota bacterium]
MIKVKHFFDEETNTLTYIVSDPKTKDAVIIDPVLNYDRLSSITSTDSTDAVIACINQNQLKVHFILETHAHADHLSGSQELKKAFPEAKLGIGTNITMVQKTFKDIFSLPHDFPIDGSQFDRLFSDNEKVTAGSLSFKIINTPGHTPACISYYFDGAVFTGDAIFMPDFGTGRCDFPGGDAKSLYMSITEGLYTLPDETHVFVCHDYMPNNRELKFQTTIGEEKKNNIQLPEDRSEADYVEFRTTRDLKLKMPALIFQSIQVNINAGKLPQPDSNNTAYLKIPVNLNI